ncbi:glycosyltransferase [Desulfuromonas acetoxidans]|uniref:glycosyltransferase n=1 Tax=Desulfuromonas acetoxidans TaxID=891 RepID=UPI002930A177|nr:glycosyltransferase [Desulfuromonas acetoxidans]
MKHNVVIAFLDKEWPPDHSFVDGLLAAKLLREQDITVRLVVSRHDSNKQSSARRYRYAACLPILHFRRAFGRFKNFWIAVKIIAYLSMREKDRGHRVVLFVRNDPVCLLAGSLMRKRFDRLIFQSSFPHEEYSGTIVKRVIAKVLYRFAGRNVDIVIGVSPEGVARVRTLCPFAESGECIPLLSDLPFEEISCRAPFSNSGNGPKFIYIGTHHPSRELENVLAAIVQATRAGAVARYLFVGATSDDESRLSRVKGVSSLVQKRIIEFKRPVRRKEIPKLLSECDIGITLIPPKPVYYESSPTKLAEYMGAGLAVLASQGIPMQERFVEESEGGILVEWDINKMSKAIMSLCEDAEAVLRMKSCAKLYAIEKLQYSNYMSCFIRLVGLN